jgi:hypothetical protein
LARLYADENFPNPTMEVLRRLGHDVLTVAESGQSGLGIVAAHTISTRTYGS